MFVRTIRYSERFKKGLRRLSPHNQTLAIKAERLLRIIFIVTDEDILFIKIGTHDELYL